VEVIGAFVWGEAVEQFADAVPQAVAGGLGGLAQQRFGVGIATVIDWVAVWRESGRVSALSMGGDRSSRLKDEREWLLDLFRPAECANFFANSGYART
jgi:hypothetical protein